MVALPAGDVAGDLAGAAGRAELAGELRVLAGELGPLPGHVVFADDRPGRARRLAGATASALAAVGAEHPLASQMQPARQSPAQALSSTPVHGPTITSVMGCTSLRDLPVRPAGCAGGPGPLAGRLANRRCATSPPSASPAGCGRCGGCAARSNGRPAAPRWR